MIKNKKPLSDDYRGLIIELAAVKGLNMANVAKDTGLSINTVRAIFKGQDCNMKSLKKVLNLLGAELNIIIKQD